MEFTVVIEKFNGPLDLMLHLIKEKELDLFDLDIFELTNQYLTYLNQMEALKLEIASEYLTMLATLIEYKSKRLLPTDESELESEYEEDQRDLLVKRLLEYQRFKEVLEPLESLYESRSRQIDKPMESLPESFFQDDFERYDGSPYELTKAMQRVLRRLALSSSIKTKFTQKEISVDEMITTIRTTYPKTGNSFTFNEIVNDCESLQEAIVAFLAILDLIRLNLLYFSLHESEIWLRWE